MAGSQVREEEQRCSSSYSSDGVSDDKLRSESETAFEPGAELSLEYSWDSSTRSEDDGEGSCDSNSSRTSRWSGGAHASCSGEGDCSAVRQWDSYAALTPSSFSTCLCARSDAIVQLQQPTPSTPLGAPACRLLSLSLSLLQVQLN